MKVTATWEAFEIAVELDAHDPAEVEAARRLMWNVENHVESVENTVSVTLDGASIKAEAGKIMEKVKNAIDRRTISVEIPRYDNG